MLRILVNYEKLIFTILILQTLILHNGDNIEIFPKSAQPYKTDTMP